MAVMQANRWDKAVAAAAVFWKEKGTDGTAGKFRGWNACFT